MPYSKLQKRITSGFERFVIRKAARLVTSDDVYDDLFFNSCAICTQCIGESQIALGDHYSLVKINKPAVQRVNVVTKVGE